jgi:hypothetical protein
MAMLLTEEDARRELCPHITYCINERSVIQDRASAIYQHQNCQASDCRMAWRWGEPSVMYRPLAAPVETMAVATLPRRGYCGISGKPEETR